MAYPKKKFNALGGFYMHTARIISIPSFWPYMHGMQMHVGIYMPLHGSASRRRMHDSFAWLLVYFDNVSMLQRQEYTFILCGWPTSGA